MERNSYYCDNELIRNNYDFAKTETMNLKEQIEKLLAWYLLRGFNVPTHVRVVSASSVTVDFNIVGILNPP